MAVQIAKGNEKFGGGVVRTIETHSQPLQQCVQKMAEPVDMGNWG